MKGGAAALMLVAALLAELRDALRGRLSLTLVCDEETFGEYGARWLLANRAELVGDALLSAEPSSLGIVRYGEKGFAWSTVEFAGPGGHGGYPGTGPSPIEAAARFLLAALELAEAGAAGDPRLDATLGDGAAAALGATVVNVGAIAGGAKVNTKPERCRVEVDVRVPQGRRVSDAVARLDELAAAYDGELTVWNSGEPNASDPQDRLFRLLATNVETVTGSSPLLAVGLGCTDARLWRARGVPAAVFGPSPRSMGIADERVAAAELVAVAQAHALTAFDYLRRDEP
jgi:succinyl-diaminopimelate desuccinylase